jgi:glutathione peroxidase
MLKKAIILILLPVIFGCSMNNLNQNPEVMKNFHDFKVTAIDGSDFEFAQLKGKKVMIVNTASKCGLTPQYKELEKLFKEYGGEKFIIIGFPANDFFSQEPGTNEEIQEFCQKNYGVSFPMMAKISVKGKEIHPLYEWLTKKQYNGIEDVSVSWNFQKFLIDEEGNWVKSISPKESVNSEVVINWLTGK